jgi:flagellar basal-body rod protein FlgF
MYTGLYTAVSGGMAQEQRLSILTNNLANATTTGYKFDKAIFHALNVPAVVGEVQVSDTSEPVVTTVDPTTALYTPQLPTITVQTDFSQGPIRDTGNPLDLALEGSGFFVVELPDGTQAYTRQGSFSIDGNGLLVTQSGLRVQGEQGSINVSGGRIEIDTSGGVMVDGTFRDRLKLVEVSEPGALEKMGDALFRDSRAQVEPEKASELLVRQGAVELSNSPMIRLLGAMIQTSRAYEAYQRVIQIFDDTAGRAVNDIAST